MRAEDCFLRYVVHRDRNAEHGSQGDQIRSDMTMYEGSVVCSPVCHHTVNISKRFLTGRARNEPGRRPGAPPPPDSSSNAHPKTMIFCSDS